MGVMRIHQLKFDGILVAPGALAGRIDRRGLDPGRFTDVATGSRKPDGRLSAEKMADVDSALRLVLNLV